MRRHRTHPGVDGVVGSLRWGGVELRAYLSLRIVFNRLGLYLL